MNKQIFGFAGLSGVGKTLLEDIVAWFRIEGYAVSVVKHSHHAFDLDQPGKDSYRMREAGAQEVALVGAQRWVLMQEFRGVPEPPLEKLIERLSPCDVVFVEGYKTTVIPKIEIFRPSLGRPPLWPDHKHIVAVASDEVLSTDRPVLDLNDTPGVATFIRDYLSLPRGR